MEDYRKNKERERKREWLPRFLSEFFCGLGKENHAECGIE
jgi:hypothetical protein